MLARLGLAVLIVAVITLTTIYIPVLGEHAVFLLFFLSIIQIAFWLGLYAGILAGVLSLVSVNLFLLTPAGLSAGDMLILNAGFVSVSMITVVTATFHRRVAAALWESRQDLAQAQTVGQIGNWRLNVAGNQLTWSAENYRIFGVPKSQRISYETFLSVVHPEDREYVSTRWQAALRGEPYDLEHRLVVAGKLKWVRERARFEFDKNGKLIGGFGTTQDITECKGLQEQLAKVAASVPGLICSLRLRLDGSARMSYASPVIESIYGMDLETVSQDLGPIFSRIHADDIAHVRGSIAKSARSQQPWRDTYRYNHPVKGEVWHEGHSIPTKEIDGDILWHGYVHDVTERIRSEKLLEERIARYELVLNGAQDAIWDWDVLNKRINYSSRWKILRGYADEEIGNSEEHWRSNIHPDDQMQVLTSINNHFAGKTPVFTEEYRINCKDGSWKWILNRGIAEKDASGEVIRMAGSECDITERKLADYALRDRETELRLIMDATPAFIAYLDTEFRYLRINVPYEKWLGLSSDRVLGQRAEDIVDQETWRLLRGSLLRARSGEQLSFEQQIPYAGAEPRWMHATYIPVTEVNGSVRGIIMHLFDIEERMLSEMKVALLNQRLQSQIHEMQVIFNTVPVGLSIADDPEGRYIRGNRAIEEMLGFRPDREFFMSNQSKDGIHITQNDVRTAKEDLPMQRALQGECVSNQVIDIVVPKRQAITVLCNASPLLDQTGVPRGAVGAFLDITPLKQAEKSLEKSQLQLLLFVEQAPLSIAMFDRDMHYLATSRRWLEEFGRGYDNLVGLDHYEVNPDLPLRWKQIHQQALAGEFLKNDNDLWVQADGTQRWLRWSAYPWINRVEEIGGIIIAREDISAHRRAEQELRTSQARLAMVIEQVKAGYWDWDIVSRKLYVSSEIKQQLGYDDGEMPNRTEDWKQRLHPEDKAFVLILMNEIIAGQRVNYDAAFRLLHKDGDYRWIHSRGVLLTDVNDQPQRILGLNLDITEYMKQKQISERRDNLESSFRLYVAVQTAAAIAHELNQPLAAISSYADVALQLLQTENPNQAKLSKLLENCSAQAQRAGQVIRQLLGLLQKDEDPSEPMDINAVVHDTIDLIDTEKDCSRIVTNLAENLPPVMSNGLQVQKVLINLMRNGLESMQEKGKKDGRLLVMTRRSSQVPAMVQVSVRDYGKGVSDVGALKKIFQPFYTTKANGLGMGLAISRSLITAHGGKMWAEQNGGPGLTIHFTLPFVE
jgi:PAS domain S-box-containing protein